MPMKTLALGFAALAAGEAAQAACNDEIGGLRQEVVRLEQAALKRQEPNNLIVKMSDGSLRDLRGEAPMSEPLESWFDDAGERETFMTELQGAEKALIDGDEQSCQEAWTRLKTLYDSRTPIEDGAARPAPANN
ncbi:hypothetical protein FDP22_13565 [Paroceanicella profunda]|uniref:Uncharacterized protein n=1 Tax=Paroceanicella profunda TaxID=2579971 RepID=A0A5B8FHQ2_9RHOB|nr:hypothetical protein [Paroceanicella profunda]QDL92721.1 hypothetical protein FDP22_13565 [Paroceanicella profunda]